MNCVVCGALHDYYVLIEEKLETLNIARCRRLIQIHARAECG